MLLPNHLMIKKTKTYRSCLIGFLGWGGEAAERLKLLVCRTHAPGKSLFLYKSQLIITFPPLGLHLEFPYVDFRISIKIIENHWKAFASNAIWTSKFCHFYYLPLGKPFWASISMTTVFCIKIHVHFTSCRKRSRACIIMKFKVLGLAQTFHRAPLDPLRASLFRLSAPPKTSKVLTR